MQHPEEGMIHAWIDGALGADEARGIESHVASCASCAAAVAEARGLVAASSRIVGHLDAVPGGVIPAAKPRKMSMWSRSAWPAAIAATLVVGIGIYSAGGRTASELAVESISADASSQPIQFVPAKDSDEPATRPASREIASKAAGAANPAPVTGGSSGNFAASTAPQTDAVARKAVEASVERQQQTVATVTPPPVAAAATAPPPSIAAGGMAVMGKSADAAQSPTIAARSAVASDSARINLRGAVGGRARSPSAPVAERLADVPGEAAFVGCYEMEASADILPQRFALLADSAATGGIGLAVAYLDAAQRVTERVADASWSVENGVAVVRQVRRGTILVLSRTGLAVTGETPNGPRSTRVLGCSR